MRLLLFFDLPTDTIEDRKNYTHFRKNIIKLGYIMVQFSVYIKGVNVKTKIENEENKLVKILPPDGNIRLLTVTELQYQNIKLLIGQKTLTEKVNDQLKHIVI